MTHGPDAANVLRLQRTIGNRATAAWLASRTNAARHTTGVLQRDVGFEFEDGTWSSWAVQDGKEFRKPFPLEGKFATYEPAPPPASKQTLPGRNIFAPASSDHYNTDVAPYNLETAAKKGALHQGTDFKIEPDGPYVKGEMDIEFVTEPFPETTSGASRLEAMLMDMAGIVKRLDGYTGRQLAAGNFVTPDEHQFSVPNIYLTGGKPDGNFKVQATQGLPLDKIPALMEIIGSQVPGETPAEKRERAPHRTLIGGKADKATNDTNSIGNSPSIAKTVIDQLWSTRVIRGVFEEKPDTGALHGLLSLMAMYLQMLSYNLTEGVKPYLPLMSRYSFPALFSQLPSGQQRELKANPGGFAAALSAGLAGTRAADLSQPLMAVSMNLWDREQQRSAASLITALRSVTRADWVTGILNGQDLLTANDLMQFLQTPVVASDDNATQLLKQQRQAGAHEYGKSIGVFQRGHGNAERVKDTGENLAVFENRAIVGKTGSFTMSEAAEFALEYFKLLRLIKNYGRLL